MSFGGTRNKNEEGQEIEALDSEQVNIVNEIVHTFGIWINDPNPERFKRALMPKSDSRWRLIGDVTDYE